MLSVAISRACLLAIGTALVMTSSAFAQSVSAPAAAPVPTSLQDNADTRLKALFAQSHEAMFRRNPFSALVRGDARYADRLGDLFSDDWYDAERRANEAELEQLRAIDRSALSPTNQIAYDTFEWRAKDRLKALSPDMLALTAVRPLDHFSGFHTYYPGFAAGQATLPFKTVLDYENNLKRNMDYVALLDRAIWRFRQGMASGVTHPRIVVENMIEQFDTHARMQVEDLPFYRPVTNFPKDIPAADQLRLKAEYAAMICDRILPANARIRDFLKDEYLPVAREGVGLVHMKGGARLYALMIEQNTTLPYSADAVHKLGLAEVKRIKREMDAVRKAVGFKGTMPAFIEFLRTDPRFKMASRADMTAAYYAIGKRVDAMIHTQFSNIPKTPLEIRPFEEWREKTQAGGAHQPGLYDPVNPSRSRPGIFYFNAHDLPSRTTPRMETLYLHEAVPGHHFQTSLANENADLPGFMRYDRVNAYVEGWALYAESLWHELGMETDPYQRFGGWTTRCCAPCASSWTAAFTQWVGRKNRPSSTCSLIPAWEKPMPLQRSNAISRCRLRPLATRSVRSPSSA